MGGQGDKKIIAVIGSTGKQGGALTKSILADRVGEFAVRALTRNPEKVGKSWKLIKLRIYFALIIFSTYFA